MAIIPTAVTSSVNADAAQMAKKRIEDITAEAETRRRTLSDPHSPGEFSTNGVVRNVDEWYTAFDVKPGDKLYLPPEQRVRIW